MRPTHSYARLPVTPCDSYAMADCCITQHTTTCFLVGFLMYIVAIKKCFQLSLPLEQCVPIVGIIATNNGCTCQNHQFGCGNALLNRPTHGCGVFLCLKKMPSGDLLLIFYFPMEEMGARLDLLPRTHCWVMGYLPEWSGGADAWGVHTWVSHQSLSYAVSPQPQLCLRRNFR